MTDEQTARHEIVLLSVAVNIAKKLCYLVHVPGEVQAYIPSPFTIADYIAVYGDFHSPVLQIADIRQMVSKPVIEGMRTLQSRLLVVMR